MSEQIENFKFELVGPRAGKTINLGGFRGQKKYQFINGVYSCSGTATGIAGVKRILAKAHNAHMPGSPEHARAVAQWKANPASQGQANPESPGVANGNSCHNIVSLKQILS